MGDVFTYTFTMQQADYLALNRALGRGSLWSPLMILVLFYGAIACFVMAGVDGDPDAFIAVLRQIGTGRAPLWFYPLLLVGPLIVLLRPLYLKLLAGQLYRRSVLADRNLTYRFTSDAIQGGIPDVQGRYLWSAIRRIIVTPRHAFLAISKREALIIPRRAIPTDEDFETLLGFARARMEAARSTLA